MFVNTFIAPLNEKCCVGFTAVLRNFAHSTTTIIIIMLIFYMFIRERAHGLCLEREGLSEQHPIYIHVKKSLEGDWMNLLPVEPAGNSMRLPIGARGNT